MSKSKAELSITKRLLLDFIKYKTNNNHIFFMGNDKIAAALGLTVNSAKVMVNELIREGYLLKSTDIHGRRVLNFSGKPYLTISCVDLSNIDKAHPRPRSPKLPTRCRILQTTIRTRKSQG